eukprot:1137797-Pyramimonas_sp.AAC.1
MAIIHEHGRGVHVGPALRASPLALVVGGLLQDGAEPLLDNRAICDTEGGVPEPVELARAVDPQQVAVVLRPMLVEEGIGQ